MSARSLVRRPAIFIALLKRRPICPTLRDCVGRGSGSGFSLVELLVVIAIGGIVIGVGVPMVLSYYHSAQVTTGAQQVRTLLNLGRQIALDQKTFVCVQVPTPTQPTRATSGCSPASP